MISKIKSHVNPEQELLKWKREKGEGQAQPSNFRQSPKTNPRIEKKIWLRIPKKYWVEKLEGLNVHERAVLCTFISHMGPDRVAWPSLRKVAEILHIHRKTCKNSYNGLVKKGIIKVIGKVHRTNKIKVL